MYGEVATMLLQVLSQMAAFRDVHCMLTFFYNLATLEYEAELRHQNEMKRVEAELRGK